MLAISLIFIGLTLVVNGMVDILGKDKPGLIVLNLFTALFTFATAFYQIITAEVTVEIIRSCVMLLFGVTHLLIAYDVAYGGGTFVVGMYSIFAMLVSVAIGVYLIVAGSLTIGIIAIVWSLIWLTSFLANSLSRSFRLVNSIMDILQGILTTFVLGILILIGVVLF